MSNLFIPKIEYGSGPIIITFEYPAKGDPLGQELRGVSRQSVSKSGKIQTTHDYTEDVRTLELSHISQSIKDAMDIFFRDHGYQGKSFSFFEDKDDAASERIMKINRQGLRNRWQIIAKRSADTFVWKTKISMRRIFP